ncbi:hypothetical protein [Phenylobacterium sp.]|uniref:hypothetical protein n=1 Tax=Phenylobacterium sp. TaxID=1871053 RepID=UPI002811F755|nr:hypothetical protein [Phenylobacterium sp.]
MSDKREDQPEYERGKPGVRPDRDDASPPQTDRSADGPDGDRQIAQERQQSTGLTGQT